MAVTIGHGSKLTRRDFVEVVRQGAAVELPDSVSQMLLERRQQIVRHIEQSSEPSYGFNRGFGHNVDVAVDASRLRELQRNIIRSHSSSVGPAASAEQVRGSMLLRAHSLSLGNSAVRPELVQQLVDFLNRDICPLVPTYGSVGASGDLAPLSHIALALMGEGEVLAKDGTESAAARLKREKLKPLELEMKEGLALNNGVQFSAAAGFLAYEALERQLKTACLTTALSAQVLLGSDSPFLAELHALRPHPGAKKVAAWIWNLMQDSPLRSAHEDYDIDGMIQDPYSLRCAAQVLGSCAELIEEAAVSLEIEANSATDNPLLLPDDKGEYTRVVSGGHFHGMPIATRLYGLMQALGMMSRLSNMRCARFVDEQRNHGLGSDLIWPDEEKRQTASGMMIPEYVSAALTNAIWGSAMPSHLFSLSTDAGQEDFVSMSSTLATRLLEAIPRLDEILAIELAFCSQAAALRKESHGIPSKFVPKGAESEKASAARQAYEKVLNEEIKSGHVAQVEAKVFYPLKDEQLMLSPSSEELLEKVAKSFPVLKEDRVLSDELRELSKIVASGELLQLDSVTESFSAKI